MRRFRPCWAPGFSHWNRQELTATSPQEPMENLINGTFERRGATHSRRSWPECDPRCRHSPAAADAGQIPGAGFASCWRSRSFFNWRSANMSRDRSSRRSSYSIRRIGFFHESRAQATIAALKSRLALNASVLRDGAWTTLAGCRAGAGRHRQAHAGHRWSPPTSGYTKASSCSINPCSPASPCRSKPGRVRKPMQEPWSGAAKPWPKCSPRGRAPNSGVPRNYRTAYVGSTEQKAVFRVVRNLAGFNGAVTALLMM